MEFEYLNDIWAMKSWCEKCYYWSKDAIESSRNSLTCLSPYETYVSDKYVHRYNKFLNMNDSEHEQLGELLENSHQELFFRTLPVIKEANIDQLTCFDFGDRTAVTTACESLQVVLESLWSDLAVMPSHEGSNPWSNEYQFEDRVRYCEMLEEELEKYDIRQLTRLFVNSEQECLRTEKMLLAEEPERVVRDIPQELEETNIENSARTTNISRKKYPTDPTKKRLYKTLEHAIKTGKEQTVAAREFHQENHGKVDESKVKSDLSQFRRWKKEQQ